MVRAAAARRWWQRVPHKDEADRREYQREYQRKRRAGLTQAKTRQALEGLPADLRVETAADILELLGWAVSLVQGAEDVDPIVRARAIGYLANVALRAVEVADLDARLIALEEANANELAPAH